MKCSPHPKPIVHIRHHSNHGIHTEHSTLHTLGYVHRGSKIVHTFTGREIIRQGEIYFISSGYKFVENRLNPTDKVFDETRFNYTTEGINKLLNLMIQVSSIPLHTTTTDNHIDLHIPFHQSVSPQVADYIVNINRHITYHKSHNNRTLTEFKSYEFLYVILSNCKGELLNRIIASTNLGKTNFVEVVFNNILNRITIDEIATRCGQSRSSFKRRFMHTFGCTPHSWIMAQRLHYARMMLHITVLPIKFICYKCAFVSASHFNRLFKQRYGHTPTEYRQRLATSTNTLAKSTDEVTPPITAITSQTATNNYVNIPNDIHFDEYLTFSFAESDSSPSDAMLEMPTDTPTYPDVQTSVNNPCWPFGPLPPLEHF